MPRPFYCGTQLIDWQEANCCRCKKYSFQTDPATGQTRVPLDEDQVCQIEEAIFEAHWGDGQVSDEIASRMGANTDAHIWQCGEVDWTEEWKAEYRNRHPEKGA
jgi:hypothetical protein